MYSPTYINLSKYVQMHILTPIKAHISLEVVFYEILNAQMNGQFSVQHCPAHGRLVDKHCTTHVVMGENLLRAFVSMLAGQ